MYYNFEFFFQGNEIINFHALINFAHKKHILLLLTILNTKVDHLGFQFYGQNILYMDHLFNKDMIVHDFFTKEIYVKVMI